MKKILFAFVAVLFCFTAQAQQRERREFNPEDMAKRQATEMKEKCTLSDEQYNSVYNILLQSANEQKAQRDSMMAQMKNQEGQGQGERPRMDREAMQKRQQKVDDSIKEILSEEQYTAYQTWQKERRSHRGQGGPGRGQRPEGNGQSENQQ